MVQMCVLYLFALRLAYARGRLSEAETRRYTAQLLRAPEVIKPALQIVSRSSTLPAAM